MLFSYDFPNYTPGDEEYLNCSRENINRIIEVFGDHNSLIPVYRDNLSLLAGLSGVLLLVFENESNKWRKLVLL